MRTKPASWPKHAVMFAARWISLSLELLCWVLASLAAMSALAWGILSSVFQESSVKPEKPSRKLPIPIRQGSEIFVIMPDDSRVKIEALHAASHARAWVDVVAGLAVYEAGKGAISTERDFSG